MVSTSAPTMSLLPYANTAGYVGEDATESAARAVR
jgi:hypothetical protein